MGWGGQYVLILMIKTPKKDTNITSCMLSTVTINAFISCFSFSHAISISLWSEKIISSISNGNLSLLMAILCFARLNWLCCEIAFYVIYKLLKNNNNLFTNSLCVFPASSTSLAQSHNVVVLSPLGYIYQFIKPTVAQHQILIVCYVLFGQCWANCWHIIIKLL